MKRPPYTPAPGTAKCRCCGKTLPLDRMEPGLPAEWTACRACWAAGQRGDDTWKNPLGPSVGKEDLHPDYRGGAG